MVGHDDTYKASVHAFRASLVCLLPFLTLACQLCDADTTVDFVRLKAKKKGRVRFTATCSYSLSEIVTGNAVFEINLGTPISGFQSQDVRLIAEEGNVTRVEVKRRKLRPPVYNVTFTGSYVGDAETPPNGTCSSLQTPATQSNCLPGWREFGYSCLLVRQGGRSWVNAQSDCIQAKSGAFLAQITTKSKSDFIKKMIQDAGVLNGVWIGGWNIDGFFMWTDQIPFSETFTDWLPGFPSTLQPSSVVAVKLPEMKWIDSSPYVGYIQGVCEYCNR